jgi:hypothetical protein
LIVNVASTENIAVLDVYGRQPDAAGNAVKLLSGVTEKIDAASDAANRHTDRPRWHHDVKIVDRCG